MFLIFLKKINLLVLLLLLGAKWVVKELTKDQLLIVAFKMILDSCVVKN